MFKPIQAAGSWRTLVNETVCDGNGELIHERRQTMNHWVEYLKEQFNWVDANVVASISATMNPWEMPLEPPTEVELNILLLRRIIAAGLDELFSVLFILNRRALLKPPISLLRGFWNLEYIPLTVVILRQSARSDCKNNRGID